MAKLNILSKLKSMKIVYKLLLMVAVLTLLLADQFYLYIETELQTIELAENELIGLDYITALRQVFEHIPEHRGEADDFLLGDQGARDKYLHFQKLVDDAIPEIDRFTELYGEQMETTETWNTIKIKWEKLKEELETHTAEESFILHTELIDLVYENMMRQVADHSSLTHDPDLETAYLADLIVLELPLAIMVLEELPDRGSAIAAAGVKSPFDDGRLLALEDQLVRDDLAVQHAARVAFRYNPALEPELKPTLDAAMAAVDLFQEQLNEEILNVTVITVDDQLVFEQGETASLAMFKLFDEIDVKFRELLVARIARLYNEISVEVGLAVLGVVFVLSIVLFVSRSLNRQLNGITQLFSKIGMGDFEARVEVTSSDELGQMATGMNSMLDNTLGLVQSREERDEIQGHIEKLLQDISGVAEGDLTKQAEAGEDLTGPIAASFNIMIAELRDVISSVHDATLSVSSAANEIQATTEHLAEGSESQSSQIVDTSSAIEEMAVSIQQVSENATQAAKVAETALESALSGAQAVKKTVDGMNSIRGQVQETSKRIKRLGESSQEIGEIVQLIGDIADRTSILALNASIQAAMAGDAGRGFAVVAEEVERLAERATDSTKKISTLIQSIQNDTNEAVSAMESTTQEVIGGSALATEAGGQLEQIGTVAKQLSELIQQISMASNQQARGSEAVAKSMSEISGVTQQTAAGAKQAAVSISNLATLADDLRQSMTRFTLPTKAA